MKSKAVRTGVIVLLALTTLTPPLLSEESQEQFTITGEVEAVERDEQNTPTAVSLFDSEWGEVLIAPTGRGKELLKHVGALVEATGRIEELADNGDFIYQMTVQSFNILEQAPDFSHDELEFNR
jgi:hypothetical protein